jgi:hypothetical protein
MKTKIKLNAIERHLVMLSLNRIIDEYRESDDVIHKQIVSTCCEICRKILSKI